MTEIVYHVAASLDGFLAASDGGIDWLLPFQAAGEDYGFDAFMTSIGALLMGSRTYEQALRLGPWPSPRTPSWVFSSRPLKAVHPSITVTSQTPREVIAELERHGIERAWLMGGSRLAGSFRAEGAITESIVSVIPVLLGEGVPIFAPGPFERLRLVEAKPFDNGVVSVRYAHSTRQASRN